MYETIYNLSVKIKKLEEELDMKCDQYNNMRDYYEHKQRMIISMNREKEEYYSKQINALTEKLVNIDILTPRQYIIKKDDVSSAAW